MGHKCQMLSIVKALRHYENSFFKVSGQLHILGPFVNMEFAIFRALLSSTKMSKFVYPLIEDKASFSPFLNSARNDGVGHDSTIDRMII